MFSIGACVYVYIYMYMYMSIHIFIYLHLYGRVLKLRPRGFPTVVSDVWIEEGLEIHGSHDLVPAVLRVQLVFSEAWSPSFALGYT